MLTKEEKLELIEKYGKDEKDTGSAEVQIAMLSQRIRELTEHLKTHKKDAASRRGMYKLIGQRAGLLKYLKKKDIEKYRALVEQLQIRG